MKKEMFYFLVLLLFISCGSQGISLGSGFLGNGNGNGNGNYNCKSDNLWLMLSADKAYKSIDAENWDEVNIPNTTGGSFVGLAYGKVSATNKGCHWLALTSNGQLFSSNDDGTDWTNNFKINGTSFADLATDGKGKWIALASNRIHKYGFSNPNSWDSSNSLLSNTTISNGTGVSYGNKLWVLVVGSAIYKISQGDQWKKVKNANAISIAYGKKSNVNENIWISANQNNTVSFFEQSLRHTNDLIYNNNSDDSFSDIAYGNGKWVATKSKGSKLPFIFKRTSGGTTTFNSNLKESSSSRFTTVAFRPQY